LRDTRWLFELVDLHLLSSLRRHEQIDPPFNIGSFAPQISLRFREGLNASQPRLGETLSTGSATVFGVKRDLSTDGLAG
jgi:hypothetical protein